MNIAPETFLDPIPSQKALGYEPGILDEAFRNTVEACKLVGSHVISPIPKEKH